MPLKYRCNSREEIAAAHLPLYVERGGAFVLDAEDAVEKAKLDEVRKSNVKGSVPAIGGFLVDSIGLPG